MIILFTSLIIIIWIIFLTMGKPKEFRDKHKISIVFLSTILATMYGVFIGLDLSDKQIKEREKEKEIQNTIKLLEGAYDNLVDIQVRINWNSQLIDSIEKKFENLNSKELDNIVNNSLPGKLIFYPELFSKIFYSEIVIRNISSTSFSFFSDIDIPLRVIYHFASVEQNRKIKQKHLFGIGLQLELGKKVVKRGIKFLSGKMSETELNRKNNKTVDSLKVLYKQYASKKVILFDTVR